MGDPCRLGGWEGSLRGGDLGLENCMMKRGRVAEAEDFGDQRKVLKQRNSVLLVEMVLLREN